MSRPVKTTGGTRTVGREVRNERRWRKFAIGMNDFRWHLLLSARPFGRLTSNVCKWRGDETVGALHRSGRQREAGRGDFAANIRWRAWSPRHNRKAFDMVRGTNIWEIQYHCYTLLLDAHMAFSMKEAPIES
jgi:hypothetical protein